MRDNYSVTLCSYHITDLKNVYVQGWELFKLRGAHSFTDFVYAYAAMRTKPWTHGQ
jgi:hypothetical protein